MHGCVIAVFRSQLNNPMQTAFLFALNRFFDFVIVATVKEFLRGPECPREIFLSCRR